MTDERIFTTRRTMAIAAGRRAREVAEAKIKEVRQKVEDIPMIDISRGLWGDSAIDILIQEVFETRPTQ